MSSSPDMIEVIRTITKLGATYPQVVAILEAAQKQSNLQGPLLADGPANRRRQIRPSTGFGDDVIKKDEAVKTAGGEEVVAEPEKSKRPRLMQRLRNRMQADEKKPSDAAKNEGS